MNLLIHGRIDLYLDDELTIASTLNSDEFQKTKIVMAGVMSEIPLYAYLHKTHADLVPQLTTVLKEMRTEGLIDDYRTQAVSALR